MKAEYTDAASASGGRRVFLCRKELPDYMVPEAVRYRDDLPRTPRGKIDYRALETEAQNA